MEHELSSYQLIKKQVEDRVKEETQILTEEKSAYQLFQEQHGCDCKTRRVRYKLSTAGSRMFYLQCLSCGQLTRLAKNKVTSPDSSQIGPVDQTLIDNWNRKRTEFYNKLSEQRQIEWQNRKQQEREEWFGKYTAYLQTPAWREKRAIVLKRDNYICQGCLKNKATQAHHLTYERVGNEMLFDLISVCEDCHRSIHS